MQSYSLSFNRLHTIEKVTKIKIKISNYTTTVKEKQLRKELTAILEIGANDREWLQWGGIYWVWVVLVFVTSSG